MMTRLTISAAVVCLLGAGMAEASPAPRSQQMNPRSGMKLGSRMMNPFKAIGSMFRRQKPVKPATPTLAHLPPSAEKIACPDRPLSWA